MKHVTDHIGALTNTARLSAGYVAFAELLQYLGSYLFDKFARNRKLQRDNRQHKASKAVFCQNREPFELNTEQIDE